MCIRDSRYAMQRAHGVAAGDRRVSSARGCERPVLTERDEGVERGLACLRSPDDFGSYFGRGDLARADAFGQFNRGHIGKRRGGGGHREAPEMTR